VAKIGPRLCHRPPFVGGRGCGGPASCSQSDSSQTGGVRVRVPPGLFSVIRRPSPVRCIRSFLISATSNFASPIRMTRRVCCAGCGMPEFFHLTCPHCDATLRFKNPAFLGRKVRCPKCNKTFMSPPPSADSGTDAADAGDQFLDKIYNLGGGHEPRSGDDELEPAVSAPRLAPSKISSTQPKPATSEGDDDELPAGDDEFGPAIAARRSALPSKIGSTRPKRAKSESAKPTSKPKKRARSRRSGDGLPTILWPVCGFVGGAFAGVIWVAAAVAIHRQVGIIAWGVGAGTGLGIAMAAGRRAGDGSGLLAVGVAFCVIFASKFVVALLLVNQLTAQLASSEDREQQVLVLEAAEIAHNEELKGKKLQWPRGKSLDNATELSDFPDSIQEKAQQGWDEKTPEVQQMLMNMDKANGAVKGFMVGAAFIATFSFFDLLWFFLAGASAFRIGRGFD
jgi:predicted Zn finger-like uncharacterized protein